MEIIYSESIKLHILENFFFYCRYFLYKVYTKSFENTLLRHNFLCKRFFVSFVQFKYKIFINKHSNNERSKTVKGNNETNLFFHSVMGRNKNIWRIISCITTVLPVTNVCLIFFIANRSVIIGRVCNIFFFCE